MSSMQVGRTARAAERIRRGGVWLAVVSASALLLAPGTAVAQQDTPSILSVRANAGPAEYRVFVTFSENLVWPTNKPTIHVCFDSDCRVADNVALNTAPGDRLQIKVHAQPSVGQTVRVSYSVDDQTAANRLLRFQAGNRQVEDFRVEVVVTTVVLHENSQGRQIPTVYEALGAYFSGKATLFGETVTLLFVNSVLQQADGQSYHEALLELVDEGRLDEVVPGPESAWGDPGTEDWAQMGHGFPKRFCYRFQGETRCIEDTSETWGWGSQYSCGNKPQPGFHENDFGDFFWACNDGQWVPVRRPRPGVDYSHDNDLIRPDPNQNVGRNDPDGDDDDVPDAAKCLFRDEDGNLAPVFRADFHPQNHPNPQLRGKPIRDANGNVQGTTIHGRNWDPIAKVCRGS